MKTFAKYFLVAVMIFGTIGYISNDSKEHRYASMHQNIKTLKTVKAG